MGRITEHIDYCFLACYEQQGDKIREECPIYHNCYSRQMHEKLSQYEDLEERIEKLFDGKISLNEAVEEIEKKVHGKEVFRYSRILTNAEAEKWDKWLDLEEQGRLIATHEAAVVLAETFGYEHPCNFNGIDEWFPDVCHLAEMCPDGKTAIIDCWEQYFKIKLKELKEGAE